MRMDFAHLQDQLGTAAVEFFRDGNQADYRTSRPVILAFEVNGSLAWALLFLGFGFINCHYLQVVDSQQ
jgi:hypothetical protein